MKFSSDDIFEAYLEDVERETYRREERLRKDDSDSIELERMANAARCRRWRRNNPEADAKAKAKWRNANPDKLQSYWIKYYEKHREKVLAYQATVRAERKAAPATETPERVEEKRARRSEANRRYHAKKMAELGRTVKPRSRVRKTEGSGGPL